MEEGAAVLKAADVVSCLSDGVVDCPSDSVVSCLFVMVVSQSSSDCVVKKFEVKESAEEEIGCPSMVCCRLASVVSQSSSDVVGMVEVSLTGPGVDSGLVVIRLDGESVTEVVIEGRVLVKSLAVAGCSGQGGGFATSL